MKGFRVWGLGFRVVVESVSGCMSFGDGSMELL